MRHAVLTMFALSLGGCGTALVDSRSISYLSPPSDPAVGAQRLGKPQRLFIWKSGYSAGIGTRDGICVQGALTATANSTEASGKIGAAALSAINPALAANQNDELVSGGLKQAQSVMLTNATNGQTAFANIAMFYLCQISLNSDLDAKTISTMWAETNKTIATISSTNAGTASINASLPGSGPAPAPLPPVKAPAAPVVPVPVPPIVAPAPVPAIPAPVVPIVPPPAIN